MFRTNSLTRLVLYQKFVLRGLYFLADPSITIDLIPNQWYLKCSFSNSRWSFNMPQYVSFIRFLTDIDSLCGHHITHLTGYHSTLNRIKNGTLNKIQVCGSLDRCYRLSDISMNYDLYLNRYFLPNLTNFSKGMLKKRGSYYKELYKKNLN